MAFNQYSLDLNGSSQYTAVSACPIDLTTDFTIEMWVKLDAEISSGTYEFIHLENNTQKHVVYLKYEYNGGTRRLAFQNDRWVLAGYTATHNVTLGTSNWNHIAMVKTGTTLKCYLNGVNVGTDATSIDNADGTTATNTQTVIGAGTTVGTSTIVNYANAKINNVRIWSDARSTSEIADNMYSVITGTADNLAGAWYTTTNDHNDDSQSNNLTATGSPTFSTLVPWTGANSTDWSPPYEIQSDNTKVSGSSNLTNFPALISSANLSAGVYSGLNNLGSYALDLELSSSQYASITDASQTGLDFAGDFTVEAWIKLEQLPTTVGASTYFTIVAKYDTGSDQRSWMLAFNVGSDSPAIWYSQDGGATNMTVLESQIPWTSADVGTWQHLAVSVDVSAKTCIFYKNGVAEASFDTISNGATSVYNSSVPVDVGAFRVGGSVYGLSYFDGQLDNIRVWDDIRTASEIASNLYTTVSSSSANLVANWLFENNYLDETSNNNDLTASGSPVFSTDVKLSGSDLRITTDSAGTTEVPFEIVNLDTASSTAEIWAKVPTLSYNTDTSLFIWYGNTSAIPYDASAPFGSEKVWSDYRAVYHLEEATNTTRYDSTANSFDLTESTSDDVGQATGQIGNGADFELGDTEYLNNSSTTILSDNPTNATIQAWYKPESQPATDGYQVVFTIVTSANGNNGFIGDLRYRDVSGTKYFQSGFQGTSGGTLADNARTLSNGTNYFLALTKSSTTIQPYYNGSAESTTGTLGTAGNWSTQSTGLNLGVTRTQNASYADGVVDEVRVRESALSADWIATEYNNQNDPGAFWSEIGSPSPSASESASPSASPSPSSSPSASESSSPSASESSSPSLSPSASESRSPSASPSPSSSPSASESPSPSSSISASESRSPSSSESRSPSASPSPSSSPSSSESASPSSSISSSPSPSIGSSPSSSESASESRSPSASPSPSSSESASESPSPSSSVSASPSPSPSSSESPSPSSSISATPSPSPSSSESRSPSSSQSPSSSESASESSSPSASESPSPSASESASPSSSISASPSPAQYADKYDESVGNTYIDKYKNWYT